MPTGKCTVCLVRKGFGFIEPDDSGEEIFVHNSESGGDGFRSLAEGEGVEYEVKVIRGKPTAYNVTGPGGAAVQGVPSKGGGKRKLKGVRWIQPAGGATGKVAGADYEWSDVDGDPELDIASVMLPCFR